MFTGIIETTAEVVRPPGSGGGALAVATAAPWTDLAPGESIAVNGACLTATSFTRSTIEFDVVAETARASAIGLLRPGDRVNLERSMKLGDRFGGHYVLGHVDCTGTVEVAASERPDPELLIRYPPEFAAFLVPKGSIAVNGVSLTLGRADRDSFTVYLVPYTLRETNLGGLARGDAVNLEFDYFGKWAVRQLRAVAPAELRKTLERAGFLAEDLWST